MSKEIIVEMNRQSWTTYEYGFDGIIIRDDKPNLEDLLEEVLGLETEDLMKDDDKKEWTKVKIIIEENKITFEKVE